MATVFKRQGKGPWIIQYFDHLGKRRERSTRTTDKRAADRLAAKLMADVALRRDGVIDPRLDRMVEAESLPLSRHVKDYLRHLRMADRSPLTVRDAKSHLDWMVTKTGASRLSDLTLDAVVRALDSLVALGRSARTVNHRGQSARAFLRWCVRTGRLTANPLEHLPKRDEERDRCRVRRPISYDELSRLFAVADERGRGLWYRMAFWAGLRRSDLRRLRWSDVDLERGVLVISHGKAHRIDEIPIHPELRRAILEAGPGIPAAKVFPTAVTNRTRQRDFERAKITLEDERGEVADLQALRKTLGTQLAREGIQPQVARRIMRHADYRTTLEFYTSLTLADDAAAMARISSPSSTPSSKSTEQRESMRRSATNRKAGNDT